MSCTIVIATVMRETGKTGVQTHFNNFRTYLSGRGRPARLITPFSHTHAIVLPVFAMRRLIDPLSGAGSVWWYRQWHSVFLEYALVKTLQDGAPLTVYAQCPLAAKAALRARRNLRQRVIMVAHFNASQGNEWTANRKIKPNGRLHQSIKRFERRVLPQLDGLVYVSHFCKDSIEREIPEVAKVPSAVIPNFIVDPQPSLQRPFTGDLITIGALVPVKNHSYLIRVLAEANRIGRRYTLTIVGDGPERQKLESLANRLGVAEQIRFAGSHPNASTLILGHRVYCHSASLESFGIALVEAMACGVPVLAAPVGGVPGVFSDGIEGYYWELDDPAAGARRLVSLLDDEGRYSAMSHAARSKFSQCYEQEKVGQQLETFLEGIGAQPGDRPVCAA